MRKDASVMPGGLSGRYRAMCAAIIMTVGLAGSAAAGPKSALYLTDFSATIRVVQGDAVVNTWTDRAGGGIDSLTAIAVGETVRTYSQGGAALPSQGAEYTLDGVFTGALYTNNVGCCFRDGTTDGVHNYALREGVIDPLYRFNRDWENPQVLDPDFAGVSELGAVSGITFDPRNASFWLAGQGIVFNVTLQGDVLSFFATGTGNLFDQALAFDTADNTLWLTSYENGAGVLRQYDPSPGLPILRSALDTMILPGVNVAGAEFAMVPVTAVPESATWTLMLLGFGLVGAMRRRAPARREAHTTRTAVALAAVVAMGASPAAAATYFAHRELLSGISDGSVDIEITTDGTLGFLTHANILDWRITMFDGFATFTLAGPLSGNNSIYEYHATGLLAVGDRLKLTSDYIGFYAPGQGAGGGTPTYCYGEVCESSLRDVEYVHGLAPGHGAIRLVPPTDGYVVATLASIVAPNPVPEPATWALLILGFGVAGARLRGRRSRGAAATGRAARTSGKGFNVGTLSAVSCWAVGR